MTLVRGNAGSPAHDDHVSEGRVDVVRQQQGGALLQRVAARLRNLPVVPTNNLAQVEIISSPRSKLNPGLTSASKYGIFIAVKGASSESAFNERSGQDRGNWAPHA